MKLTRRQAAGMLLGTPPLVARSQAESPGTETPEQLLAAAKNRLRRNVESLAKVEVAFDAEPAFAFKAQ